MNIGGTRRDLEIRRVGAVRANIDIWTRGSRHWVKEGLRLDRHFALGIWTLLGSGHYDWPGWTQEPQSIAMSRHFIANIDISGWG